MAIGRNILSALGGMLNRGPDQEDPTLTPEERERRRRLMMANRTPFGQKTATPLQTGGGLDQTVSRMEDAAQEKKLINDARKVAEAREEGARRTSNRRFDESRRDLARDKSREEQEARMSRQNLTDAQSGARSDFADMESEDRILEGIMQGRAEDQAQEQADQDLIDANRQASEQRRDESIQGRDLRREMQDRGRMLSEQRGDRMAERGRQSLKRSMQRLDESERPETEETPGLLSRLGGMVKGNPELFAQIAQLGGGLISGMAQDKAQRRADATTQDRMARANLIGALTGRTPGVAEERADTGGFFSLDTLGKAIQGGGAIATGELARRDAEAEQQRQIEMENARFKFDKKVDEENRALKQQGLDFDIEFTRAELALKEGRLALDEEGQKALNSWRERQATMSDEDRANLKAYREQTIGVQQERNAQLKAQYDAQIERELEAKAGKQFKAVRDGIKDVNESTKLYQNGAFLDPTNGNLKLYGDISSLFENYQKDRNPANVTGIINTFQRMFDPATVREGDIALYRESEGKIKQLIQSALTVVGAGGSLSPFTVTEMKNVADELHELHVLKAKQVVNEYVEKAYEPEVREKLTGYYGELFTLPELPKTEAKDKDGSRRNRGDRRNTDNTKTGDSTTDDIDDEDLEDI